MSAAEKIELVQLSPARLKGAEYARTVHVATAESGHTREQILKPEYFAHSALLIKPYDRIEVRQDEGKFFMELLVLNVGKGWVQVKELSYHELEKDAQQVAPSEYDVAWKGPHLKFVVIRKKDGERIKDGFDDKNTANLWLSSYIKATA